MPVPLVTCAGCGRGWYSRTLAEGLRSLAGCPRCGTELSFADGSRPEVEVSDAARRVVVPLAPHMVLGVPRR